MCMDHQIKTEVNAEVNAATIMAFSDLNVQSFFRIPGSDTIYGKTRDDEDNAGRKFNAQLMHQTVLDDTLNFPFIEADTQVEAISMEASMDLFKAKPMTICVGYLPEDICFVNSEGRVCKTMETMSHRDTGRKINAVYMHTEKKSLDEIGLLVNESDVVQPIQGCVDCPIHKQLEAEGKLTSDGIQQTIPSNLKEALSAMFGGSVSIEEVKMAPGEVTMLNMDSAVPMDADATHPTEESATDETH